MLTTSIMTGSRQTPTRQSENSCLAAIVPHRSRMAPPMDLGLRGDRADLRRHLARVIET